MTKLEESSLKPSPIDMEKWREIILDWESSKESQKAYCQRLGISVNTFTYVRSKMKQSKKPKKLFIPITLSQPEHPKSPNIDTFIIENPQGFKLHVSSALSLECLTKLFKLCGG